jgi:hypothetical protein
MSAWAAAEYLRHRSLGGLLKKVEQHHHEFQRKNLSAA